MINMLILGAAVMAGYTISLCFLRFWKLTRDRFFLFFFAAFGIEATTRLFMGIYDYSSDYEPLVYIFRLLAFILILCAIADKNRAALRSPILAKPEETT